MPAFLRSVIPGSNYCQLSDTENLRAQVLIMHSRNNDHKPQCINGAFLTHKKIFPKRYSQKDIFFFSKRFGPPKDIAKDLDPKRYSKSHLFFYFEGQCHDRFQGHFKVKGQCHDCFQGQCSMFMFWFCL